MDLTLHSVPSKDFTLIRPRISFIVSKRWSRAGLAGVGPLIIHQGSASCPLKEAKRTKGLVRFSCLRNCWAKGLFGERWQNQLRSLAFFPPKVKHKACGYAPLSEMPSSVLDALILPFETFPSLPGRRGGFALSSVFLQHIVRAGSKICYRVLEVFCLWLASSVRRGLFLGKEGVLLIVPASELSSRLGM